jgi:diaminohydroxyphosphoribosylaminopyrimidine deaminase/5-amino-6-(5-phosphoribosylamino)uracil reductase
VLVRGGRIIGRGWHRRAGAPHAEIEALRDAERQGVNPKGATLYVTLEPCCTHGRTPPCTEAILAAGIRRVVAGATDPNPRHRGRAFRILRRAGVEVEAGVLGEECDRLNEAFNHWIVHGTPFVTVKAAMTLDGKIATASGESKWITGEQARDYGMRLRRGADAILVGINTILADDPSLTWRSRRSEGSGSAPNRLRRIILDARARTPLGARVLTDECAPLTTIVVGPLAPERKVAALSRRVRVLMAPLEIPHTRARAGASKGAGPGSTGAPTPSLDLRWLLRQLGGEDVTGLLVEGGGETNASFLLRGLAHRIAFFYAPKILGGRDARRAVAGEGACSLTEALRLAGLEWRRLDCDWLLTARVVSH